MRRLLVIPWLALAAACGSSSGGGTPAVKHTLTVTASGSGTVTSSPTGVTCGATCAFDFQEGTAVTLTAAPGARAVFTGWSGGGCSGAGRCVVAMAAAQTVTATFAAGLPTTWDPAWSVVGVTFGSGNLAISGNSPGTKNARTLSGKRSGKWYWEVAATGGDGVTDQGGLGIAEAAMPRTTSYIGSEPTGLSFGYAGYPQYWMSWSGATLTSTLPPTTSYVKPGIVYMFALDMDSGKFWAGQDGTWYGGGDPVAGTAPVATGLTGTVHPAVTFYEASALAFTANFGATPFAQQVPAGFGAGLYDLPTAWDPAWSVAGVTYGGGNLAISGNSAGTKNVRTAAGRSSGRWYWEVAATGGDGVTDQGGLGIAEAAMPRTTSYIGSEPTGLSFGYSGFPQYWMSWSGATLTSTLPPASSYVKAGVTYTFALDLDAGKFWAGQDGVWYGGGDPSTGASPVATGLTGTVYPAVTFYGASALAFTADFGATAFAHPVPAGFIPGFF